MTCTYASSSCGPVVTTSASTVAPASSGLPFTGNGPVGPIAIGAFITIVVGAMLARVERRARSSR
jgi:hypothetical protein